MERVITIKRNYVSDNLINLKPSKNSIYRLFCFPHAGGGRTTYSSWAKYCREDIELIAIQLPGRENRIREMPLDNLDIVTKLLTDEILGFVDKPFAFFGHSLGSILSYEVCKKFLENKNPYPNHLFLSSCRAPHIPILEEKNYLLNDEQFIYKLKELNGTPDEVLNIPELRNLLFPMLRADFKLAETYYREMDGSKLPIPITCFRGHNDTVSSKALLEWEKYTDKSFNHQTFLGNHFYLNNYVSEIMKLIEDKL